MDAIEDLKKQATNVLKDREQATGKNESLDAFHHSEVANSLEGIHEYLNTFLEQLRVANPSTETSLNIDNISQLAKLTSTNHRLYTENTFSQLSVGFSFILQCNKQTHSLANIDEADRDKFKNKLRHLNLEINNQPNNQIEINGQISSNIKFRANYVRRLINLSITNILNSEIQTYEVDPDTINSAFMNELGNYLLLRENKFIENIMQQEKNSEAIQTYIAEQDEPEPTLTEMMESSLVNNLFKDRQQLYLTYHERIKELTSRDEKVNLGRSGKCDFIINSDCASRQHASLIYRRGKFIIADDSTNGTFIKPQGGKEIYIHSEDYPLSGSGFISLGESISVDNEHLIYYSCQ